MCAVPSNAGSVAAHVPITAIKTLNTTTALPPAPHQVLALQLVSGAGWQNGGMLWGNALAHSLAHSRAHTGPRERCAWVLLHVQHVLVPE